MWTYSGVVLQIFANVVIIFLPWFLTVMKWIFFSTDAHPDANQQMSLVELILSSSTMTSKQKGHYSFFGRPSNANTQACRLSAKTNGRWKLRPNWSIFGDAILPQSATKLTKMCGSEFGGLLWCHLMPQRKPQYACTTTVPQVLKSP